MNVGQSEVFVAAYDRADGAALGHAAWTAAGEQFPSGLATDADGNVLVGLWQTTPGGLDFGDGVRTDTAEHGAFVASLGAFPWLSTTP